MVTNKTPAQILKDKIKTQKQYIKELSKKIIAAEKLNNKPKGVK